MASANSAPKVLSDTPSHDSTPRSARKSARAKGIPADVCRAPSDAPSITDLSLIPFENARNAFRNNLQNSQIDPFWILPGDLSNLGLSLLPSNTLNLGTGTVSIPGHPEHDQPGVAAKEKPDNCDERPFKLNRRTKIRLAPMHVVSVPTRDTNSCNYTIANIVLKRRALGEIQQEDQSNVKIEDQDLEKEIFHDSKTTLDSTDTAIPVQPLHPRAVKFDLDQSTLSTSPPSILGANIQAKSSFADLVNNPFAKATFTDGLAKSLPAENPSSTLSWAELAAKSLFGKPTTTTDSAGTNPQINPSNEPVVTSLDDETAPNTKEMVTSKDSEYRRTPLQSPSIGTPIETPLSAQAPDSLAVNLPRSSAQTTPDEHPLALTEEKIETSLRNMELIEELIGKISDLRTASLLRPKMLEAGQQVKIDALQRENSNLLEEKNQARREIHRLKARVVEIEQETQADKQKTKQFEKLLREISIHVSQVKSLFPNMPFASDQEMALGGRLGARLDAIDSAFQARIDLRRRARLAKDAEGVLG
ncbi:hypothetical protein N7481_003844 [Penicillium waksmanii]|uniref:uncharacterized protein n=1 Tax=Penicillium waksmanii TaxID=69791 RepID=UPI0025499B48|nr:uncharacterized protein N7481_003844 [Penicillium waksmanii]KAJ5988634.1 hypothetical protein N7481_003844 [Penicillium waksmanii]